MNNPVNYEILYIIRPDLNEDEKKELVERFDGILTSNGGSIEESKDWGKRRLAYEIDDYKEGIYHLIHMSAEDSRAIDEFDRLALINRGILRHLVTRIED